MSQAVESNAEPKATAGLLLRSLRSRQDYAGMAAAFILSERADQVECRISGDDLDKADQNEPHFDPFRDVVIAEVTRSGVTEVAGFGRVSWWDEQPQVRIYGLRTFLVPGWRRAGIGRALLWRLENRVREMLLHHPPEREKILQVDVTQYQGELAAIVEQAAYHPARYFLTLLRPDLQNIPDLPLPEGLEVRPARPEHYRAIWQSMDETGQDEWGHTPASEEAYQEWVTGPHFQPELWQVAWDVAAGRVAGHVLAYEDHLENRQPYNRRGYIAGIGVQSGWRRRGLAGALVARSLQAQKAAGMSESALVSDSAAAGGVCALYERFGFQVVRRDTVYRKRI